MSEVNKKRFLVQHKSREFKYWLNEIIWNSRQNECCVEVKN